jgi:hypothetical protein
MCNLIHLEFKSGDPKKAIVFYDNVFGFTLNKWGLHNDCWLNIPADMNNKAHSSIVPISETVSTFYVSSLDKYSERILMYKGKIIAPPIDLPGLGRLVECEDDEGNRFKMLELKDLK